MQKITTHQAKTHLSRYLAAVEQGETFLIARGPSARTGVACFSGHSTAIVNARNTTSTANNATESARFRCCFNPDLCINQSPHRLEGVIRSVKKM